MPKINVYLPADLAEAVKGAGLPVSAICQQALSQALRRANATRAVTGQDIDRDDPTSGLKYFTEQARAAVRRAVEHARADEKSEVGTGHLLGGLLADTDNPALRVLRALNIEPNEVAIGAAFDAGQLLTAAPVSGEPHHERFSRHALDALEAAVKEASSVGKELVGCEHLLLALVEEGESTAGYRLRAVGAHQGLIRRAVESLQDEPPGHEDSRPLDPGPAAGPGFEAAVRRELDIVVLRLDRLEENLDGLRATVRRTEATPGRVAARLDDEWPSTEAGGH